MKYGKYLFTIIFIVSLFTIAGINFYSAREGIVDEINELDKPEKLSDYQKFFSEVNTAVVDNLAFGHWWNEVYATVYNGLGKNEENGFKYVRDKDGKLYPGDFWNTSPISAEENARRIRRAKDSVKGDTKLIVLIFPNQYNAAWSDGYYGMPYEDYSDYTEELEEWLRYYGVDYIDYSDFFKDKGYSVDEIFFKTDHHWRPERAFEAFQYLTDYLNTNYDEKLSSYYTNIENYNIEYYKNAFIGSQGRDAGVNYVGLDDYELIVPKFDTAYYYEAFSSSGGKTMNHGRFDGTLVTRNYLAREDYYYKDAYCTYLNGICIDDMFQNLNNPDGLNVLYIRDSFASPLASFFSAYCNTTKLTWAKYKTAEDQENMVESGDYDYIFIALAPASFTEQVLSFYPSDKDEGLSEELDGEEED